MSIYVCTSRTKNIVRNERSTRALRSLYIIRLPNYEYTCFTFPMRISILPWGAATFRISVFCMVDSLGDCQ